MAKLSSADHKLLIDAAVSVAFAIITGSPTPLASPTKSIFEHVTDRLRGSTKSRALRRNIEKTISPEILAEQISEGCQLAADLAAQADLPKVLMKVGADPDKMATEILRSNHQPSTEGGLTVARIAIKAISKNTIDVLTADPSTASILAFLAIQSEAGGSAPALNTPRRVGKDHDWTTGFEAQKDRRRLSDPRSDIEPVEPAIGGLVDAFLESWRKTVAREISNIHWPHKQSPFFEDVSEIRLLPVDGTYTTLLVRLREGRTQRHLMRIRKAPLDAFEGRREHVETRHSANWLLQQASTPEMFLVLPITGQWGSGKGRALFELANQWHALPAPVLYVSRRAETSLEASILEACKEGLGRTVENRMQLVEYVREFNHPLLILMDRLDLMEQERRGSIREFATLVEQWSDSDAFRWAISFDQNTLIGMPPEVMREFWPRYGVPPRMAGSSPSVTSSVGGLLDLDTHNLDHGVGLKILVSHGPVHQRPQLSAAASSGQIPEHALLAISPPLPAWVRLQAEDASPLEDIHGHAFLGSYWELVLDRLESQGCARNVSENYIEALAFDQVDPEAVPIETIEMSIPQPAGYWPDWSSTIVQAREGLIQHGLLEIDAGRARIPLEFSAAWGYRMALVLLRGVRVGDKETLYANLDSLDLRAATGDQLAECALSSFVDGLAMTGSSGIRDFMTWLQQDPFTWAPLWEATIGFEDDLLEHFLAVQASSPDRRISDREAYLVLRTARLRHASTQAGTRNFFNLLSRAFEVAKMRGLVGYCFGALQVQLRDVDWNEPVSRLTALLALNQFHEPGLDYQLAVEVAALGEQQVGEVGWLGSLRVFLAQSGLGVTFPTEHTDGLFAGDLSVRNRLVFWRSLVRIALEQGFQSHGPAFVQTLVGAGWLFDKGWAADGEVRFAVQQEANVALGHCFHGAYRDQFIELVEHLATASVHGLPADQQREMALFAMRHSVSTYGDVSVVHASLGRAYNSLLRNRDFARSHSNWIRSVRVQGRSDARGRA